jgi:hypothetical protein
MTSAVSYDVAAIPLAAAGFLNPLIAGAAIAALFLPQEGAALCQE